MLSKNGKWGRRWLVSTAIGLFLISTASANQVTNGDMETGGSSTTSPTGWNSERGVVGVSTDTPSGSGQSLSITSNENTYGGLATHYNIPVEAGAYKLSFSYKGGVPRWLVMNTSDYSEMGSQNLSPSSEWMTYSTQVTIPSGVTSVMLFLYSVNPNTTVLIDDVILVSAVSAPVFSPSSRYMSGPTAITISSATTGASIYYTTDRTPPTTTSTLYQGPVTLSNGMMLQAIAVKAENLDSSVTSQVFFDMSLTNGSVVTNGTMEVGGDSTTPPDSWGYLNAGQGLVGVNMDTPSGSGQSLSVYNNTEAFMKGAVYQYIDLPLEVGKAQLSFTYKGDVPRWALLDSSYNVLGADNLSYSDGWTVYSTQIDLPQGASSSILILYAYNPQSTVLFDDVSLTPVPTVKMPVFSPENRYLTGPTAITITCATAEALIYYTTNGSIPTTSGTGYASPVTVTVNVGETLRAMAVAEGYPNSNVTSQTFSVPSPYNNPGVIPAGTATVDGHLSEWSDAVWTSLNQDYNGNATDIPEAYYAARWQSGKIYVAVKVRDTAHYFTNEYGTWNGRDAVEIYLHTDNNSDTSYSLATTAQQYIVGITASDHTKVWTAIGGANTAYPITADMAPLAAQIGSAAGSVDGEWIYYEVAMTPFSYLGALVTNDLSTSVYSHLDAGEIIGLDVCVVGSKTGSFTGMKSENMMKGKSGDWQQFGLHKLVEPMSGSTAVIDSVTDGTISATGSSNPALVYGNAISTVNWISAATGSKTFDLTHPKYNLVVSGTVTGLTGESVNGNGGWMNIGLLNKHYLDGLAIGMDPAVTYASGQYGFGQNGGLSIVGGSYSHSDNNARVNIHDGWPKQIADFAIGTNAFDFKIVYGFLDGDTRDTRAIRAYYKPVGGDEWIWVGMQNTLGYPLNANNTDRAAYYLQDQWNEIKVGLMVAHDAADQTASISFQNVKLAYEGVLAGDANFDGSVDVGDLGILAANYGGSGKTWAQGDFNGDGLVDVGDLGILAAHYGTNASSADWASDYAKTFGTTVEDDLNEAEVTSSSICSDLGLPLVAGLLLMGLMLVKLEE